MTAAEADSPDTGFRAGAGHPKPEAGMETGPDREVILTLDHGVLLVHDPRAADPAFIDEIFEKASRRQVRTVLWRTLAGARGLYRSRSVPSLADQSEAWERLLSGMDPLEVAVASARRHGIRLFAWATLQDFHIVRHWGRNTSPFYDERPHLYWAGLDGRSRHPGIPCYAYEEARRYYLDHLEEVREYGVDGLFVCFRSHAGEPAEDDGFGYNEPWLKQLREETGVDAPPARIREFPWLACRLQRIRGDSYTVLLREVREAAGTLPVWVGTSEEPDILIAGHSGKENPERALLRARMDLSRWCREDLVDAVVVVTSRLNPCDPSMGEVYRDTTARFGKKLYTWLNMICHFHDGEGNLSKRTPTPPELRGIVRAARGCRIDGLVLHETADLETSYLRIYVDGSKQVANAPHPDRDAQWDALLPG